MSLDDQAIAGELDRRALCLPDRPKVDEIRWERYVDSLGDDALRVWIILDDATRAEELHGARAPIRQAVRGALQGAGIDLFPYLRLVTHAELAEAVSED